MSLLAQDESQDLISLAPTPDWNGDVRPPSLGARIDEAAVLMQPIGHIRLILVLLGGLTATRILGWPASIAWVLGGWAIEGWCALATQPYANGSPVDQRSRLNFAANYLVMNLWWVLLSALFWRSDSVAGHASAAVILLAILAIMVLLFHNVPAAFLAAGAAPSVGALSVVAFASGHDWTEMAPVWVAIVLGVVFCLGRALETPSMQQSNRRLNISLNKFQVLAENVPDLIARFDLEGCFIYASPASVAVLGYTPKELVGMRLADLLRSDDPQTAGVILERLMTVPDAPHVITTLARHKDGRWVWLQTTLKLVHENGVPVGVIGVSRDITERMAADAALQAAKSEAESANRIKSEFLANISHEFRTPMNGVLGALHLLESEMLSPGGAQLLLNAKDCGRTLSQLLSDVLDFSQIVGGQFALSPEPVDVGELLRSITDQFRGEAASKGIELRCEISGACSWIEADPAHLRQAMFNLVGNAMKFTAAGRVAISLRVDNLAGGRRALQLDVEDTGIGIPPEVQTRLFEQFRQADGSVTRRFGGAGLGLAMTRAIMAMMGGEIRFVSTEGMGSTFSLKFDAPAAEAKITTPVAGGMLDGVNILLVEDNPTNQLVARTLLTRLGAAVDVAEDGLAGLEAARQGAHDLILMDIQMPRMGGVEAARAIRKLPGAASEVPIIALTANVMAHQQTEYIAAGMNGVVAKPISPTALLTQIARLAAA